ncbi:MAG: HD-GYP domain-containing protein [Fimbriimonadaceae bacterium]
MKTLLFVDDEPDILSAMRRMLHGYRNEWTLLFAVGGQEALDTLAAKRIDAVVTDVNMPGVDGLELLTKVAGGAFGFVPVIVVTGAAERDLKRRALELGAQDLLSKPVNHEDLIARLRSVLAVKHCQDELSIQNALLEDLVAERTAELAASRLELVVQLSKAAELRDVDTGNHVLRVAMFSKALAIELGMTEAEGDELLLASTLHDIGKIAIPDAVLRKEGSLDPLERTLMESHCIVGHRILTERDSALGTLLPATMRLDAYAPRILSLAGNVARLHHERWDGRGYPDGLSGPSIPLAARIVAVADALDALRSQRPYKAALDWQTSRERILEAAGTHFDPAVCEAFVRAEKTLMEIDANMRAGEVQCDMEVAA